MQDDFDGRDGWFPVLRSELKTDLWRREKVWRVWEYIKNRVAHKPQNVFIRDQYIRLEPGQMVTGRRSMAKECGLTERETRTALDYLKASHRTSHRTSHRFSIITIVNWEGYREAMMGNVPQNVPQNDHEQEVKELKDLKAKAERERARERENHPDFYESGKGNGEDQTAETDLQQRWRRSLETRTFDFDAGEILKGGSKGKPS